MMLLIAWKEFEFICWIFILSCQQTQKYEKGHNFIFCPFFDFVIYSWTVSLLKGFYLLPVCHQTTAGRRTRTRSVLDMSSCSAAILLTFSLRWCGAEGTDPMRPSPPEWRSVMGCCGSYLCRRLIRGFIPVGQGKKTELKCWCYWMTRSDFIFKLFQLLHDEVKGWDDPVICCKKRFPLFFYCFCLFS